MLSDSDKQTLLAIAAANGANFVELARIAGLEPSSAFRGADLRDVDFQGCDLNGFDFTGADLSGASFEGASLNGAIFKDVPLATAYASVRPTKRQPDGPVNGTALTAEQSRSLNLMQEALDERGRALALMPMGTGRSKVILELIALTAPKYGRTGVIVTSAAERDQMISLLRDRMPGQQVISSRDAREKLEWDGIVVHSSSPYDRDFKYLLEVTFSHLDLLFSTSLERLSAFIRLTADRPDFVRMAVFETPLIDVGGKDFAQQKRLVHELFGKPTVEFRVEEALKTGLLVQAKIVQPYVPAVTPPSRTMFSTTPGPSPEELSHQLQPVTDELVTILHAMRPQSLLVLCRDPAQSKSVNALLSERLSEAEGIKMASLRWSAEKIRSILTHKGGIVIAPLSRQSLNAARLLPNVAVLTPMRLTLAQELAFRPADRFSRGVAPLVIDLANAFTGFPSVETVMRIV